MFHVKDTLELKKCTSSSAKNEKRTHKPEDVQFLKPHSPWHCILFISVLLFIVFYSLGETGPNKHLKGWHVRTFVRKEFQPQAPYMTRRRSGHSA